jgi:beta-glucosidase/6-phospho-beta-glucosidase/beta-galactosidase
MALSTSWYEPATNSTEDIEAAKRAFDFSIGWLTDPMLKGDYPESMRTRIAERSLKDGYLKSRLPQFTEREKKKIKGIPHF